MQPQRDGNDREKLVCLLFGTPEQYVGWGTSQSLSGSPVVGALTNVRVEFESQEGETGGIDIPAVIAWVDDEGENELVYLYGGELLPSAEDLMIIDAGNWSRLAEVTAAKAIDVILGAPAAAQFHDVVLIIGDPNTPGTEDSPQYQVWNRPTIPDETFLPIFGERLPIDLFGYAEVDEEGLDEDDEDLEDDPDDEFDEGSEGLDEDDEDLEEDDTDPPVFPDPYEGGTPTDGYPALVIYTAITGLGEAAVAFWIPRMDGADGFDLTAAGWEMLDESRFNKDEFRVDERISLAMRTNLMTTQDEEGFWYLTEAVIDGPETVREDQYELLPPALVDQCRFASELTSLENIVETWRDEDDEK